MGLATLLTDIGAPSEHCGMLRGWLYELVTRLSAADTIRCATDTADPTVPDDLDALWSPCDVPAGGFVIWYNSVSTDTLYYATDDGSTWTELTL